MITLTPAAVVKIKPVINSFGRYTDVFITYNGEFYYTRLNYALNDTPIARANEWAAFERRMKLGKAT